MGYVFEEITLKNSRDMGNAMSGIINEQEIRQKTVQALVDTGAHWLVINEELRRELGLEIIGEKRVALADNTEIVCQRTGSIEIQYKDRFAVQSALVVPDRPNVLLGAAPLEEMDLIVDPLREEVTGRHGDKWYSFA
jgi:clan AA aspartic protease